MRPPADAKIFAPEFPAGLDRLNAPAGEQASRPAAMLVEFWDFARVHSLRTLPYLKEWHTRYAEAGLDVIGVHSPATRSAATATRSSERSSGSPFPTPCCSTRARRQRLYGNRGWPGRYLFDWTGKLALIHYGEGDYEDTERAIGECLELEVKPLEPLRPEDATGVPLAPQTADIALPADRKGAHRPRLGRRGGLDRGGRTRRVRELLLRGRRRVRGAVGRRPRARALRERRNGRGRLPRPAAARRAVHAHPTVGSERSASACPISRGSMKRTSSWTTSNSDTSAVPRSLKKVHEPLHQLLRRTRARRDPHNLLAFEPLLLDLAPVVDQVGLGAAVVARHLHEPVRVRGVARAVITHEVVLRAIWRTAIWRPPWWRSRCHRISAR